MKICQIGIKLNIIFSNIIKLFILLFIFIITIFWPINYTLAAAPGATSITAESWDKLFGSGPTDLLTSIDVFDRLGFDVSSQQLKSFIGKWQEELANKVKDAVKLSYWSTIFNQTLTAALNSLAYDAAVKLTSGGKGQGKLYEDRSWGQMLKDTGDNAAGTFLENWGKLGPIKFNLCSPNPSVIIKIGLGLRDVARPKKPVCSFSELTKNWDTALKDKDFLPKFQDMFNPWSNDLGIALTLQTGIVENIDIDVKLKVNERTVNKGWLDVTNLPGGIIKKSSLVESETEKGLYTLYDNIGKYSGNALVDAINIFINKLAVQLIQKLLERDPSSSIGINLYSLADPNSQSSTKGVVGAENMFRNLTEPNFKVRGDYNILSELTMCPDPNKAGPTNCVIEEKFRQAIEKRLTIKEAMDQGYLSANGVFGFTSDGLEPRFNEGYPYRSMLILRKFRILPVGWEIAAQKIKDRQAEVGGTKNLSDLVNCAAAWCAGLVDPNWVLKAEQNYCKKEGAGPEIISEQVTGEGAGSSLSILRNDTYCADEQSCIKEKSDGACQAYGYCTEERRKWDFNGKSCEPRDNTCQTFSSAGSAGSPQATVSYLQNTLDYGVCDAGNAGCLKYATTGSFSATSKTIVWDENANPVYLNKTAATCEAADQGCHGFIRTLPDKTETYADIKTAGVDAAYNRFSAAGLIYEKLLPDYLKRSCYSYDASGNILDGALLTNAPAECSKFVRQCKEEEAGCELYTNAADGAKIPAKAAPDDYCPAECAGYDTFIQKETNFDASRDAYFIPKTAKTCSAEAAGCDQFTNLDEVKKGGEGVEYYTALRQCVKKTGNAGSCGEFYTWEGSDESGYQLKVESLKASGAEPAVTASDAALCAKDIYNLAPSDPAYNADCRQFYNREGGISYHLYNRTISCSDDCHPYRKTPSASSGQAEDCAGGGVWSAANSACVYNAIPGQGATCSAAQSGCREYTGNTGNDVRIIFTDDFSGGTTGSWVGVNGAAVAPSSEAITLDADNKGNSLSVAGSPFSASRPVGSAVISGKSYVLNFVAKAAAPTDLNLSLTNSSGAKAAFAKVSLSADWQIFQTNLTDLNHAVSADEILLLQAGPPAGEAGQNFYIDSLTLTEITDRYYLIKNSWQTPAVCDQEPDGTAHDYYMLGCGQYTDRADKISYLKNFSELCSESAVGCELMIDTKNSTATAAETFVNSGTTKTVPADSFTYVVYDKEKQCNADAKGCSLLGKPYKYETTTLYGDIYLKNNPDKYNQILCGADAAGCQAFAYDKGEKYFKDPGDMACEWRRQAGAGESEAWFKKKVKRCLPAGVAGGSDTGAVCLSDADCLAGVKCQMEITDKPCPTDENKTLGLGGAGGRVSQPGEESGFKWAGICAAADSGCGEYIDPVSKFNNNLIFNGSFQKLAGSKSDGWESGTVACPTGLCQTVTLEPNTVYRLGRAADAGSLTLTNCSVANSIYEINSSNNLDGSKASLSVPAGNSRLFYYKANAGATCKITAGNSNGAVELKPVVVDYQLAQNLDSASCNGQVNFDKGCVLFNQRIQDGANLAALKWDADTGSISASAAAADKDANAILKVTPDRTCDKWLACRSYIKDEQGNNICYDVGLCDAMDNKGDCSSFLTSPKTNQTAEGLGADKISNLSGYAKAGLSGGSLGGDYYAFGVMKQKGEVVNLANGGFEYYGSNGYPVGWTWSGQEAANKSWDTNIFSVINNPISAQAEGIGYAREGASFLKLGSSYDATSEEVDVIPNIEYIITAYVNTKNLKSGQAKIDIIAGAASTVITEDLGNDWQFQVGRFTTGAGVSRIKIKLHSSAAGASGSEGNFYFDDIKIRPALESKCLEADGDCKTTPYNAWYTTQSCRLYSKTDSMSCDYYEDSGNRLKGWYGYCLEYDRAPGNSNACILWYPVDKVKGDGIEEGAGYQGKAPVYYCAEAKSLIPVEYRWISGIFDSTGKGDNSANGSCSPGYARIGFSTGSPGCGYAKCAPENSNTCYYDCKRDTGALNQLSGPNPTYTSGWYAYNGFDNNPLTDGEYSCLGGTHDWPATSEAKYGLKFYDPATKQLFDDVAAYCTKVVETVNSVGDNKHWASRVYKGSDYKVPGLNYQYSTNYAPFGSVAAPSSNPYDWDGDPADGNQPLMVNLVGQSIGAPSPYKLENPVISGGYYGTCANTGNICLRIPNVSYDQNKADCAPGQGDCLAGIDFSGDAASKLKLLFAKSYGAWTWNQASSHYETETDPAANWSLPAVQCTGNTRTNPADYCAVAPAISNVKINNSGSDVNLTKNGFVNLTFNTKVDSNQLPLVMYAVEWGDGESTTVTGVEMRDRPNPDNPHSLYHLYGYWDLKAKASSGITGIDCSTAGVCKVKPKVQIKDNWGWCNHGGAINACGAGQWDNFGGLVVVKEK